MTEKEKKEFFNEKYFKWHQFLLDHQNNYEDHLHLSYEKRLELEKKVADLVDFCNENGIYMHEPNDIFQFMISLKGNGSRELSLDGFSICTKESCYASIHLDETLAELNEHAKSLAEMDVWLAESKEKEAEEKKKQEEADRIEYERRYAEACKRNKEVLEELRLAEELDALSTAKEEKDRKFLEEYAPNTNALIEKADKILDEDAERDRMAKLADMVYETLHGEKSPDAIADKLIEQVNAYANLKDYDALSDFDFSMCTHEELEAVDEYILQCQRFTDAQNRGLTGLGLYTFNNDRMDAHEKMLEAWDLDGDMVALSATKGFDYCSDWNHKMHQYDARPKKEAELMLCWVLWKCRKIKEGNQK